MSRPPRVIVVGAGAFGGWTALTLRRAGASVTLVEGWRPGHARSSSGGSTRVLRLSYPDVKMLRLARRSRELWRAEEARSGRRLFQQIGLLWLAPAFGGIERAIIANFEAEGIPFERPDRARLASDYPVLKSETLEAAILEPGAGYLHAREACRAVAEAFVAEGGDLVEGWAVPERPVGGSMTGVSLDDGSRLNADSYLFAGGPWLPAVFPELLVGSIRVTRQEVFTFSTPPGRSGYGPSDLPVWACNGERFWYGIPGDGPIGGFKVADDTRGPDFDPDSGDRVPTAEGLASARAFLADRFPGLAEVPLIDAAVCQYSQTPDGRFLVDRHPEASNLWLVGGGSGHGFKHGPALAETIAALILNDHPLDRDLFRRLA